MIAPSVGRSRSAARMIEVRGTVQGVGFRPFVWMQAERFGLAGWVRNRGGVIEILAEGTPRSLEDFCAALSSDAPALAHVVAVDWRAVPSQGLDGFEVDVSRGAEGADRPVSPDLAPCAACLAELFDPNDRRYRYPFIDCSACGPRFTIIESLPYGRERTSMKAFPMCEACRSEYEDAAGRRFRNEPISCPKCGPSVTLLDRRGRPVEGDPIERAADELRGGAIVAIKGLGGFHLACDATDQRAVARLRRRAHRPDEPFAVMVSDLDTAQRVAVLTPREGSLLASPQAPVVLVRDRGELAASMTPGCRRVGTMLPSTPLHHLLLREVDRPLVMTGGAAANDPVCIDDRDARERLASIADAFLMHDRQIAARYDDSVALVRRDAPVILRRGRSFAPAPLALPMVGAPVLGTGAEHDAAFCLAKGSRAILSQGFGPIRSDAALRSFSEAFERTRRVFGVDPQAVAHDADLDLPATRFARSLGLPATPVQRHHAHVAAVMAEYGLPGPILGVVFDHPGPGDDGGSWGGEFLVCDPSTTQRRASLRPVPVPGDGVARRDPIRIALAYASDAGCRDQAVDVVNMRRAANGSAGGAIEVADDPSFTTSAGLLFDAVAALTGVWRRTQSYGGQPALMLEEIAESSATREYPFDIGTDDGRLTIDTRPTIAAIVKDLSVGRSAGQVAGRFHRTMAAAVVALCRLIKMQTDLSQVCLAGGIFANDLLVSDAAARLSSLGYEVFVPRDVPIGDGGLALGQVLVAGARMREGVI